VGPGGQDTWSGVDRGFDPRSWLRDSTYPVQSQFRLPKGYDLRIALVDESGTARVRLGNAGGDARKRYRLGSLTIATGKP